LRQQLLSLHHQLRLRQLLRLQHQRHGWILSKQLPQAGGQPHASRAPALARLTGRSAFCRARCRRTPDPRDALAARRGVCHQWEAVPARSAVVH
jgi:hypothetical protein